MTHTEYINKVKELENELNNITKQYVLINQIYKIGDYLKISFNVPWLNNKKIVKTCKIINIYPQMNRAFCDNKSWPTGELEYFARYAYKNIDNKVIIGDVCYLGKLSHYNNICGYKNIDWETVKINIIKESEL